MKPQPHNKVRQIDRVGDILSYRRKVSPDKDAFRVRESKDSYKSISWKKFGEDADCLGTALYAHGFKGKHIAVMGENSYQWILAYMTTLNGDMVTVPLDRDLPAEKIKELLLFSDSSAIVFSKTYINIMSVLKTQLEDVTFICMDEAEGFLNLNALIAEGKELIEKGDKSYIEDEPDVDKLSAIYFTSGTSGDQKGVMLSQKNMVASFCGACSNVYFSEDDVFLSVLPLHHAYESNCGILAILHWGSVICINESLKLFMSNLKLFKPTAMSLVPLFIATLYKQITDSAKKSGKLKKLETGMKISAFLQKLHIDVTNKMFAEVYSALGGRFKKAFVGGAALDPRLTKAFRDLGITLLQGYGITECSPIVAVNMDRWHKDPSVGPAVLGCEIKTKAGEILVRGENVMLGYLKNQAATDEVMDGEWFKTGDLGYLDEDGFLYITGRKKNLIILESGENISPEELESLIEQFPLVKEVVVYGSRSIITAEIFPDFDYADSEGIEDAQSAIREKINELNKSLPRYKQIGAVSFRDSEFEKTTTKKIKRYMIDHGGDKNV